MKDALGAAGIPVDDMFDWSETAQELPDMPKDSGAAGAEKKDAAGTGADKKDTKD